MLSRKLRFVMGLTVAVALLVGSNVYASAPLMDDDDLPTREPLDWHGGLVSLPIGHEHLASEILTASFNLPQTQELVQSFTERGYIRRADQDQAGGTDSVSYVFLVWQKPGVPLLSETPVIRILSKTYFDPDEGRKTVATQAFGGVLRDSSGVLTSYETGPDAPIVMGEVVPLGSPGAIEIDRSKLPQESGDVWAYRMSYRDGPGGIGTMYKDAVKASCPWRKTICQYGVAGGLAALGTASFFSGNWVAAAGLAISAKAADQWIESKWTCN